MIKSHDGLDKKRWDYIPLQGGSRVADRVGSLRPVKEKGCIKRWSAFQKNSVRRRKRKEEKERSGEREREIDSGENHIGVDGDFGQ